MYNSEARKDNQSCWQMVLMGEKAENMDVQEGVEAEEVLWQHWFQRGIVV